MMQYLDPEPRAYAFRRRDVQVDTPRGQWRCTKCGELRPATIGWYRRASVPGRWKQPCKECR